jgi:hypothetical protein
MVKCCFLCGTDWILKYYLDELRASMGEDTSRRSGAVLSTLKLEVHTCIYLRKFFSKLTPIPVSLLGCWNRQAWRRHLYRGTERSNPASRCFVLSPPQEITFRSGHCKQNAAQESCKLFPNTERTRQTLFTYLTTPIHLRCHTGSNEIMRAGKEALVSPSQRVADLTTLS